jgi:hypothetical protein
LTKAIRAKWTASSPSLDNAFRAYWTMPTETRVPVLSLGEARPSTPGPYAVFATEFVRHVAAMTGVERDTENQLQEYWVRIRIHAKQTASVSALGVAAALATLVASEFDSRSRRLDLTPDALVSQRRMGDVVVEQDDVAEIELSWLVVVDCVYEGPVVS